MHRVMISNVYYMTHKYVSSSCNFSELDVYGFCLMAAKHYCCGTICLPKQRSDTDRGQAAYVMGTYKALSSRSSASLVDRFTARSKDL